MQQGSDKGFRWQKQFCVQVGQPLLAEMVFSSAYPIVGIFYVGLLDADVRIFVQTSL